MSRDRDVRSTRSADPDSGDAFRSLRAKERGGVLWAMLRGCPLPPRLARAADDRARHFRSLIAVPYVHLAAGVGFLVIAVLGDHGVPGWEHGLYWFLAVDFLALSGCWLAMLLSTRRVTRDGRWPEC